jgi:alcohol dehydrogenase class IV
MITFKFATATEIHFGTDTLQNVGALASRMGQRAAIILGRTGERAEPMYPLLDNAGVEQVTFNVDGEPTVNATESIIYSSRNESCDMVISMGGGSVIDTGKVVAGMLTNQGNLMDYLEVVGEGKELNKTAAPHIAIPTTAGTGSEVTRNAVLTVSDHRTKVSMRSIKLLPSLALLDPLLTLSLPPSITAYSGLDALAQLIEPYVSNQSNPLTDALAWDGIGRIRRSLRRAFHDGYDQEAREEMLLASLFGGIALANAKLGAVHGIAGPVGGMYGAPHGAVCGRLLPLVTDAVIQALTQRAPESEAVYKYTKLARYVTDDMGASAKDLVPWLEKLSEDLLVPDLTSHGLSKADIPSVVDKSLQSSSMKGSPIQLTSGELKSILQRAL